jgi:DNA-binding protein Fis
MNQVVRLISQDQHIFHVPKEEIVISSLIQTMFDEEEDDEICQEIPLPNVESKILSMVLEFVKHNQLESMTAIAKVN